MDKVAQPHIYVYLSIYPTLRPLTGTSPKGVATAELSSGLPVQALSQHISNLSPPLSNTLRLYPLYWWSSPYSPSLNCALIYHFCKVTFIHSYYIYSASPIQPLHSPFPLLCFASLIQPLNSPFPLLFHSYQTSHMCPHYFLHPILTHHWHPTCNSFLQLIFVIAVVHSMSMSLRHMTGSGL